MGKKEDIRFCAYKIIEIGLDNTWNGNFIIKLDDKNLRFLKNLISNTGWGCLSSINPNIINMIIPKIVNSTPNSVFSIVNPYINKTIPIP